MTGAFVCVGAVFGLVGALVATGFVGAGGGSSGVSIDGISAAGTGRAATRPSLGPGPLNAKVTMKIRNKINPTAAAMNGF